MRGLAILLLVGLSLAYGLSVWLVVRRLRNPPRRTYAWALAKGRPGEPSEMDEPREFQSVAFTVPGLGELPAWRIEGRSPAGPIVVCSPGWGDSKLGSLVRLPALETWASEIVALDAPGMGDAPGRCSLGTGPDLGALRRAVLEVAGGAGPVVLYGWSLGGGVALDVAQRLPAEVAGVIAEAPYRVAPTPARNVLRLAGLPYRANLPVAMWVLGLRFGLGPAWRGFDRAGIASRVEAPVLVVHGAGDEVCPLADGRAIADAAPRGELAVIEGGMHNDLWTDPENAARCIEAIEDWARREVG